MDAATFQDKLVALQEALNYLSTAQSQNAQKGRAVRSWFLDHFNVDGRASVITERKQVHNRVVEQFKHRSRIVIFLLEDETDATTLVRQIKKRIYEGLSGVAVFYKTAPSKFSLYCLVKVQPHPAISFFETSFPSASVETVETTPEGKPESGLTSIDWSSAELNKTDPCGLVGQAKALAQSTAALASGKHVVLIGPPGTGKTSLAICICSTLGVPWSMATATSDWTTLETVGGYMPDPTLDQGAGQGEPLNFEPGIVTKAIEDNRWLIIDEVNRADTDKAFGELFTLLSGHTVQLPYLKKDSESSRRVVVGPQGQDDEEHYYIRLDPAWRFICTMNTFDKASLYQLSFALMRRFVFVYVEPPERDHYQALVVGACDEHFDAAGGAPAQKEAYKSLVRKLFVEELPEVGLPVGPAIALDIVRYLSVRSSKSAVGDDPDGTEFFLEALQSLLFPQFEGHETKHQALLDAIGRCVELDSDRARTLSYTLAQWTGFDSV